MRVEGFAHGVPSWVDLSASDVDASVSFYATLFGWAVEDQGPEAGHYRICRSDGLKVAGIGASMVDGVSGWSMHVNVTDVDDVVLKVGPAGGAVLFGPHDVMDLGRLAFAADPTGAAVGLWQPRNHLGAQLVKEPVSYVWSSLHSNDLEAAVPFYADVFGWGFDDDPDRPGSFTVGAKAVCGAMGMSRFDLPGAASYFDVYFSVRDAHATAARMVELGGQVLAGPFDNDGDRLVSAVDATGTKFGVAQLAD